MYPFRTIDIGGTKVLEKYPDYEDILLWLRRQHVYITSLPFRNGNEGPKLYYYYSVIDVNDFEKEDDILCDETNLGVSDLDYETYEEALISGITSYLSYKSKDLKWKRELMFGDKIL
tara:strand:- start:221 stop:571 length:351 start_codon:yes stop_codon:yes gene_type:complete